MQRLRKKIKTNEDNVSLRVKLARILEGEIGKNFAIFNAIVCFITTFIYVLNTYEAEP